VFEKNCSFLFEWSKADDVTKKNYFKFLFDLLSLPTCIKLGVEIWSRQKKGRQIIRRNVNLRC